MAFRGLAGQWSILRDVRGFGLTFGMAAGGFVPYWPQVHRLDRFLFPLMEIYMPRASRLASLLTPVALVMLAGCAQTALGALSPPNHCVSVLGRIVPAGQPVEVWSKAIADRNLGGRRLRVVTMDVTVANQRQKMECAYVARGSPDAVSIILGKRQVTGKDLAAINQAVREHRDAGAAFRKRLPSPPNLGRFTIGPSSKRKK